jgi:hypothetical protein
LLSQATSAGNCLVLLLYSPAWQSYGCRVLHRRPDKATAVVIIFLVLQWFRAGLTGLRRSSSLLLLLLLVTVVMVAFCPVVVVIVVVALTLALALAHAHAVAIVLVIVAVVSVVLSNEEFLQLCMLSTKMHDDSSWSSCAHIT